MENALEHKKGTNTELSKHFRKAKKAIEKTVEKHWTKGVNDANKKFGSTL